jgi:hypothetical protein
MWVDCGHWRTGKEIGMITIALYVRRREMVAIVVSGLMAFISTGTCSGASQHPIDWTIQVSKDAHCPGEPVLLTLTFRNTGGQQEQVGFGMDGIEAFSMVMHSSSGEIVAKGGPIRRYDVSRMGMVSVAPGEAARKAVVLNQWCSTQLLPVGTYQVVCEIAYRLGSEIQEQPGTKIRKAGPFHTITLTLNLSIVQMDPLKFRQVLEELRQRAFSAKTLNAEQRGEQQAAREMLVFAESPLAVPYQLEILASEPYTWLKRDAINSLVKSKTLEAAKGLVRVPEDFHVDDVKYDLTEAVYRMRDAGDPEILKATDEFARKHARPVRPLLPPEQGS